MPSLLFSVKIPGSVPLHTKLLGVCAHLPPLWTTACFFLTYEHAQSQCVFQRCNVVNDLVEKVNIMHLIKKTKNPRLPVWSGKTHTITVTCLQQQKPHRGYNRVTSVHVWPWTGISYDSDLKFTFPLLANDRIKCHFNNNVFLYLYKLDLIECFAIRRG